MQVAQRQSRSASARLPQLTQAAVPTPRRAGRTAAAPHPLRRRRCTAAAATNRTGAGGQQLAANAVGAAAALGLLLTPASSAAALLEPPAAAQPPQELALTAASPQSPDAWPAACVLGAASSTTEQQAAPDLVTDADVEAAAAAAAAGSSSPFCLPDKAALEATLVSGLGWVEEAGNFSESNFAALGAPSTSMWLSNSPWCLVWDAYCNVLTRRPVATKLATGMLGTFLGDMLAQATQGLVSTQRGGGGSSRNSSSSSGGGFELDLARTARLVGFSALVGTPVAFVWFSLLDQYVCPGDPTSPLAVFSKVALDQVLMAPAMTGAFFAAMTLLEGRARSPSQVAAAVRSKLRPTLLANWTVWPLAHVVNFALVPPAQRILYINVVNIAWTAFMSHMASSSEGDSSGAPQEQQQRKQSSAAAAAAARSSRQLQRAGR